MEMNLEDTISGRMAKQLQEEIDWEVLCSFLNDTGWTKVKIEWPKNMTEAGAHEISEWCRANLKGEYKGRGHTWIFENGKDATIFLLKWT